MDEVSMALQPVRAFLEQIGAYLPRLLLAIAIFLVGWLLARLVRLIVARGLRLINFNVVTERAGIDGFLQQAGTKADTVSLLGVLIYWLVIVLALVAAFNALGLEQITVLLSQVAMFLPRLILAVVIIALGTYFAGFVGRALTGYCRMNGIEDGELIGRLAQYVVVIFVMLIALDLIQVGGDIVHHSFLIILAGVVLALALAFGLGGQGWAASLLERWWPRDAKKRGE